jgi:hypothetical protein
MELLKEFTVGLVVVCIVGAVVIVLTPEGAMEKQVKTTVSLVMLLCFIYPFCNVSDLNFDLSFDVDSAVETSPDELLAESFKSQLISNINSLLKSMGSEPRKIEADIHISDGKEIFIEQVTVYLSADDFSEQENIKRTIRDKLGVVCRTEVIYDSENQ